MEGYITPNDLVSLVNLNEGIILAPYNYKMPEIKSKRDFIFKNEYHINQKHTIYTFEALSEPIINFSLNNNQHVTILSNDIFMENFYGIKVISNSYNLYTDFNSFKEIIEAVRYIKNEFNIKSSKFTIFNYLTANGFYIHYLAYDNYILGNIMLNEVYSGFLNYYIYNLIHKRKSKKYIPLRRKWYYKYVFPIDVENSTIKLNRSVYKVNKNMDDRYDKSNILKFAYIVAQVHKTETIYGIEVPYPEVLFFYDINHIKTMEININNIENELDKLELLLFIFKNKKPVLGKKNFIPNVEFVYEIDYFLL